MEISNIQLDIVDNPTGKLRAFCSMTINDQFVVKNFKVIEGNHGLFVAMPSRKLTKPCYNCDNRVFRNANYCDRCGKKFGERGDSGHYDSEESHTDIAFPIQESFREQLEDRILGEYRSRVEGDGGSVVEHRADENYDLLDFDYEGHKDQQEDQDQPEAESIPESAQPASGDSREDAERFDLFSNPNARLTSSRTTPHPFSSSSPYPTGNRNTEELEETEPEQNREEQTSLY